MRKNVYSYIIDKQIVNNILRALLLILFLFLSTIFSYGQTDKGSISGTVIDSSGTPLPHVSVILKGSNKSTLTNSKGGFMLKHVPEGSQDIIIQLFEYAPIEKTVVVKAGATTHLAHITLKKAIQTLHAVKISTELHKYLKKESNYVAKVPLENLENAQTYSSVTKELLEDQLVFSVDEGLKNVPGLQKMWGATGRGGDGGSYYNARGFILQSQLRNGVAGNVTTKIDAANLESVEVIKGPSATLFGSTLTSYGGLINRVTKKPYDHFGGEITYATGSYSFNRISADVNVPLDSAKNILFRLNTAYNYEGTFQDNGFDKSLVIAPSLSYKLNDKLSFSLDAEIYSGTNTSKQFIFFYYPVSDLGASRADELGIDYNRSYSSNDIYQVSRNANFFGQMEYKISDQWTSQTNFTSSHSFSDGPYAYFYLVPNKYVTGDPTATGSDYLARAVQSTANSELQVTEIQQNFIGDFKIGNLRNRFVGGLDFFHQNSNQFFYGADFDTIPKNGTIPGYRNFNKDNLNATLQKGFWTYPSEYENSSYSAYVSDVLNLRDNLLASAAIRLDYFDNKGTFEEASGKYTGNYQQLTFSPKFGLVYQPIKEVVSLFANYQNGFTNKTGTTFEGKSFTPEHANQLEGGLKLDILNGMLSSTISYYHIQVEDIVRPDPTNPNFSIQDGTQLSKGIEVEIIANPFNGLNMIAGFSYNDSKLEKADPDVEGRRPATAMSPYAANLWLSYKLPHGKLRGLGIGFGGNYASDNKIVNSAYYGVFILPAYTVLNTSIFYDHKKFRVGLKVDNLTNKQYWIGYTTMNPQKLRSITGSISFKF